METLSGVRVVALHTMALSLIPNVGVSQARTHDLRGAPLAELAAPQSAISNGVELANGTFVFVDGRETAVRVADVARGTVRTIGREGAGPREYRRPSRAMSDGKGGALVPDAPLGRTLRVDASGALDSMTITTAVFGRSPASIRGADRTGRIFRAGPGDGKPGGSLPIERWTPGSATVDTLGWWPQATYSVGSPVRTAAGVAQELSSPSIWPKRVAWVVMPDGRVAVITPDPYQVSFLAPDGSTFRGPVIPFDPIRVDAAEKRAVRETRGPMGDEQFPPVKPPFEGVNDVLVSPDGMIWIERMRPWNDSTPRYDLVGPTGLLVGHALLRPESRVVGLGTEGRVYVGRRDPEDGLWSLELYRVAR